MADKMLPGVSSPFPLSPCQQNGRTGARAPRGSRHHDDGPETGLAPCASPGPRASPAHSIGTSASFSPLEAPRNLGGALASVPGCAPESSSSRPRGQSLGSALSSRTRTSRSKQCQSSQREESEALMDLILDFQGQRLEEQRASLSLLPDPGPAGLCGACSPDQPSQTTLDFYYMLIQYQSDRMEDQRRSLPDLEDVLAMVPEGQEDFLSLVQRVQSRRMDEQRASLRTNSAGSSPRRHHNHHHNR